MTREVEVGLDDLIRRNPDVLVVRATGFSRRVPWLRTDQVVLAVEVVSPGSESTDRVVKHNQYARHGIPHYWQIESDPEVVIFTYHLGAGSKYVHTTTFGGEAKVAAPGLEWASFDVTELIDED